MSDKELRNLKRAADEGGSIRPWRLAMLRAGLPLEPIVGDVVRVTETTGPCPANGDLCRTLKIGPFIAKVIPLPEHYQKRPFARDICLYVDASYTEFYPHTHDNIEVLSIA